MTLTFRLGSKRVISQLLREQNGLLPFIRPVSLKAKQVEPTKLEGHDERNMRLGRPQSPHLTIYAPQLTTLLSISHRAAGMVLSGYAVAFGLGAIVLPEAIPTYIDQLKCAEIGEVGILAIKFMLAMPLTYHYCNGLRHLLWDTGSCLGIQEVYVTGYIVLLLAISSAIAVCMI